MVMAPQMPLPLQEQFSDVDTYMESLLSFATSSELFIQLCGGVHILDFYIREPDLYSAILPLSWRDWFKAVAMRDLLDLLMRERLEVLERAGGLLDGKLSSWRGYASPPK